MKRISMAEQTLKKQLDWIASETQGRWDQINTLKAQVDALQDIRSHAEAEMDRLKATREAASKRVMEEMKR